MDHCQSCPVRQLCNEYWSSSATTQLGWIPQGILEVFGGGSETVWRDLETNLVRAEDLGNGFLVHLPIPRMEERSIRVIATISVQFHPGPITAEIETEATLGRPSP